VLRRLSPERQLSLWIVAGGIVLLLLWLAGWTLTHQPHSNESQPQATSKSNATSEEDQIVFDRSGRVVSIASHERERAQSENKDGTKNEPNTDYSSFGTKPTDFFLVYFTYVLAVVGWFAVKSGERSSKTAIRAYIYGGVLRNQVRGGLFGFRLYVNLRNFGESAGVVTRMTSGFSPHIPRDSGDLDNLRTYPKDFLIHKSENPIIDDAHFDCFGGKTYFCFEVEYTDIFRETHFSRMIVYIDIVNGLVIPITGGYWNQWD
jgi:hypothetical protein